MAKLDDIFNSLQGDLSGRVNAVEEGGGRLSRRRLENTRLGGYVANQLYGEEFRGIFNPLSNEDEKFQVLPQYRRKTAPPPTTTPTIAEYEDNATPTSTPQQQVKIDPSITQGSTKVAPNVHSFVTDTVFPITRKYGIPDAVAAGQFAQEGRLGGAGAERNNFFNIGFTDTLADSGNFDATPNYKTPEEGVEAYAKFVTGQADPSIYANGEDGSKSGKLGRLQLVEIAETYRNDPLGWLQAIGPMYSSQGHQYAQNVMSTPEFRRYLRQ